MTLRASRTLLLHAPTSRAFALIAFVFLSGGGVASATSYTITVDASNETAGNPRFWAASVGTGTASLTLRADLQTHYKITNRELGMQRVRGHGVLSDDMGIYKGPGSYDWTNLDTYLNAIVSAGMRPLMELDYMRWPGNRQPRSLGLRLWHWRSRLAVGNAGAGWGPCGLLRRSPAPSSS